MARLVLVIDTSSLSRRVKGILARAGWETVEVAHQAAEDIESTDVVIAESAVLGTRPTADWPGDRVIALVNGEHDPFWGSRSRHRVVGVVGRDDAEHDVVAAVREVLDGRGWISPEFAPMVLRGFLEPAPAPPLSLRNAEKLTQREKDVCLLVAEGLSNVSISVRLCIGLSTVKFHVSNVLRKLECRDRAHLAAVLHRNGSTLFRDEQRAA